MNLENKTIQEKELLIGVIEWLKEQPEMKNQPITEPDSIFYHVAPLTYAELIVRYNIDQNRKP